MTAFIPGTSSAQSYWAKDIGGPGNDHVADVKTDEAGNIYATGEFSGMVQFGGVTHTSNGGIDMFLTKMAPTGEVLWFVQGGGPGIDRGIKLAVRDGHVAVVGAFMQTATFEGQSITSAGGPDIFLAMHDAATGEQQWIVQGGGPLASDRPYGVTIASSGHVTMVGEFSGSVNICGTALTSMEDPATLLPSVDVFIATYSMAGAPLWTRQGTAKHTDRAIDVVNDPVGNIYVTGQFSDTIQFVSTHPNVMYNATFLLKLDALGNEVWFRRVGGAIYDEVRDIQWTSESDLLLLGDLQGTMIFLDSVPDMIASGDPYAYYLLRVSSGGQLLADRVVASENPVSGRAVDERSGTITVLGQFNCQFTSMVDSAHAGLWMATGEQDLFVVRHSLDSLNIKDGQQFGGRQEKLAGQVATLNDGSPIFCGSFEDLLVFPSEDAFSADISSIAFPYGLNIPNMAGYCGDPDYGHFAADTSNGLKDGFIARGYVIGRAPYDWWVRDGSPCSYLPRSLCLGPGVMAMSCPDTIESCGPTVIGIDPEFSFSIDDHNFFIGPDLEFLWSTGATTDSLWVTATGTYAVTCTSANGCLQWSDSVHLIIHPFPPQPLLSDDFTGTVNSSSSYQIDICDPTEVWLWCSNADTSTTQYWQVGSVILTYSDSLLVDTSGSFYFNMVTAFGCTSENHVVVIDHPTTPIASVTVSLSISYPGDIDLNDSMDVCPGPGPALVVNSDFYLDGVPYTFPYTYPVSLQFGYVINSSTYYADSPGFFGNLPLNGSGWYVDTVSVFIVNGPCGTDTLVLPTVVIDSIYIHVFPMTDVDISLVGPSVICPSDTALLVATCTNCDAIFWNGSGILSTSGDSSYAVGGGFYQVTGSVLDTNGCSFSQNAYLSVTYPSVPELDVLPPDGIICPDSIAVIITNAQGAYDWFGPPGEIAIDNDSIAVTIPGEYYLALVDEHGCYLNSDPILITGYATPFLNVLPDGVLCVGEAPVLLQVVTTGYSSLTWAAPLSGNGLTQSVDQPGTYSCSVQACGITTSLSAEIVMGSALAEVLDPGPFVLCPGDSVQLHAAGGQAIYFWSPGQVFGDSLLVTQAGVYILTTQDANGCADTAAAVIVTMHDPGGPLTVADQTVCSGTPVTLMETASGELSWYADAALTILIGTGPVLDLGVPLDSTTIYLVRSDSICMEPPYSVGVYVVDPPAADVSGPDSLCAGINDQFIAGIPSPFDAVWNTPSGPAFGDVITVGPADASDAGWYVVTAMLSGCVGSADSIELAVYTPLILGLGSDTSLCAGGSITLELPSGLTNIAWSTGATGNSIVVEEAGTFAVTAVDVNGCMTDADIVVDLIECPPVVPNIITPNGDGVNDGFTLGAIGAISGELEVYDRWGVLVHTGDPVRDTWYATKDSNHEQVPDGTYYYVLHLVDNAGNLTELSGYFSVVR